MNKICPCFGLNQNVVITQQNHDVSDKYMCLLRLARAHECASLKELKDEDFVNHSVKKYTGLASVAKQIEIPEIKSVRVKKIRIKRRISQHDRFMKPISAKFGNFVSETEG